MQKFQVNSQPYKNDQLFSCSSFGKLSVSADRKWEDIFHHCYTILGCQEGQMVESSKAWETVAVMVSNGRKALKDDSKRYGKIDAFD